jgi:hypothetical protein
MAKRKSRREYLDEDATAVGLYVRTYSPGDGLTRYRFFKKSKVKNSYFGPQNGIYTALGMKEAETWLAGYRRR